MIAPTKDAGFVNAVLNDAAVRPWVADLGEGAIDLTSALQTPKVTALRGEHGIFIVIQLDAGIYEVHTATLQSGRGAWSRVFAAEGASYMFTRTDAVELLTRVPATHEAARRLTLDAHFRLQFTTLPECRFRGELVPVEVYSLSVQDWANAAPDMERRGEEFHQWLNRQVASDSGPPHASDPAHNRAVAVAIDMICGGQIAKGLVWYNRWAVESRHPLITLLGVDPVQVSFDAGVLTMSQNGAIRYEPRH